MGARNANAARPTELVCGWLTRESWTSLYGMVLDDAEELADAGATETLTTILAWVVPMLGAASEDSELRAREGRLRARSRIYLDAGARQFVESVVRVLPG